MPTAIYKTSIIELFDGTELYIIPLTIKYLKLFLDEFENSDMFKTYEFDTWYHDDFWLTTPVFDSESIKGLKHFVHFFERELKI